MQSKEKNEGAIFDLSGLMRIIITISILDVIAGCFFAAAFFYIDTDIYLFDHLVFLATSVPFLHLILTVIFYTEMIKVQFSQELRVKNQDYHKTNVKGNKRPKVVELKGHDTINAHSIKHDVSTVKMS